MTEQVWLNGRLRPAQEATIPVTDRGFTLGDGLFETLRLQGGAPQDVPAHFARLAAGAALLLLSTFWHKARAGVMALTPPGLRAMLSPV